MSNFPQGPFRKSWCRDNIFGSSRFDFSQSVRGVWNDLLDLAKLSRVEGGIIAPSPDAAYPHPWLADILNTPIKEFEEALEILKKTKRISENSNGITIIKWKKYQPEYDRQKPYREAKKIDPTKYEHPLVAKNIGDITRIRKEKSRREKTGKNETKNL